jgi:hypothetical protein
MAAKETKTKVAGLACLASAAWWDAAGTRALKTLAQTAGGALVANSLWEVDMRALVGMAAIPALISLLTSLGGLPELDGGEG